MKYEEITMAITYKCKIKVPAGNDSAREINEGVALNQLPLEIGNDLLGVTWEVDWDSCRSW